MPAPGRFPRTTAELLPPAAEFESALRRHVLDPWFPRSIDAVNGGFDCDFDRTWNRCGRQDRLLEFQSRHLLFAAEASQRFPADKRFPLAVEHGLRYLREVMWDQTYGGWYQRVSRDGTPLDGHAKHAHGIAYAITSCAIVHAITGVPEALKSAQEGFAWLDSHAHDRIHGGYWGQMNRAGELQLSAQKPHGYPLDTVGTPFGLKDLNVQSDLLEGLGSLLRVWPDPIVASRLEELAGIITRRLQIEETGAMHFYAMPDWRPVPHLMHAGYQVQTAFRLLQVSDLLGNPIGLPTRVRRMMECGLMFLKDERAGGFSYAGPGALPHSIQGVDVRMGPKAWWVQVEYLRSLLALTQLFPDELHFPREFTQQWEFIKRYLIDERHQGFFPEALDRLPRWQQRFGARLAPKRMTGKGNEWKDCNHEGRALLYCADSLSGMS